MSIALPNLDDRRWVDLVEEGRALIPFYSPEWTDHNVHDPGITLIELFAWLAEMDIFQLDRIPERNLRAFLSLIGIHANPPVPSLSTLRLALKDSSTDDTPLHVPASIEFEGRDPFGQTTRFRTLSEVSVVRSTLQAIQLRDQNGFHDLTNRLLRGESIEIYGADPAPGTEFYLGFNHSLPVGIPTSLLFTTVDLREGEELRRKIVIEQQAGEDKCRALAGPAPCGPKSVHVGDKTSPSVPRRLTHHSVRLIWDFLVDDDRWQQLSVTNEDHSGVVDYTRSLTLNGRILFRLPALMAGQQIGQVENSLHYLRCRIASGIYDAAPMMRSLALNGVFVEQAVPVSSLRLRIAASARVDGGPPTIGSAARFQLQLNQQGEITQLRFVDDETTPEFRVLDYSRNAGSSSGLLAFEAVTAGKGDGLPNLRLKMPSAPTLEAGFQLFTLEQNGWREWILKQDLNASGRADAHFTLDPTQGIVRFGDGELGRVPPKDAPVIVRYDTTRANEGNLPANRITGLSDSAHNHAVPGGAFEEISNRLAITNDLPALGGAAAETVAHAIGRAIESVETTERAVTLADYEALARQTPGTRLARVSARANLHPGFPCLNAAGLITVIVLPYLPADRPAPSRGLRRMVANYLFHRRIIGTRVEVIGPTYVEVTVHARVKALAGTNKPELQQQIINSLDRFFHPLTGGPNGTGWPFGRDVFRSEVLQVLDETSRVDNVLSLDLAADCGAAQCGNLCLGPNELIAAGRHQIEVV